MNEHRKDPSAVVVPFGKHRGRTVAELLTHDPAYAEWLLAQGWLAERFAELHTAILTRGATTDDSPEHNAIQARFLDPLFRAACVLAVVPEDRLVQEQEASWDGRACELLEKAGDASFGYYAPREWDLSPALRAERRSKIEAARGTIPKPALVTSVAFEDRGIDVAIRWDFGEVHAYSGDRWLVKVEIKPSLGEDYPTVMRQMARLGANCVLVETYTGRAVPFETVRQMFGANRLAVVTLRDVEAEIVNVRGWMADKTAKPL